MTQAVPSSDRARTTGILTSFKDLRPQGAQSLPQRIAVLAEPNIANYDAGAAARARTQVTSSVEAGNIFGFGSPIHAICKKLFDGGVGSIPVTVYPIAEQEDGSDPTAANGGSIAIAGTQTADGRYIVNVGGVSTSEVFIASGSSAAAATALLNAAINKVLEMPVTSQDSAPDIDIDPKYAGEGAEAIYMSLEIIEDGGFTFTITQLSWGGGDEAGINRALANMSEDTRETMMVYSGNENLYTPIGKIEVFNENRWSPQIRKPFVCFMGLTYSATGALPAEGADSDAAARKSQRTMVYCSNPNSKESPWRNAAGQLSKVVQVANNLVASDYGSQAVPGLAPGASVYQWNYTNRDVALKRGTSTITVRDGVVTLEDIITTNHPTGETDPAYRYVVAIVKITNVLYNLDLA